jgi:uncharacterized membrane protein
MSRIIIFAFLVLAGVGLARAVYLGNPISILLACISLVAVVVFLYIVAKANEDMKRKEATQLD